MCAIFIFQMYPQCTYKDTQSPLNIKRSSHLDYWVYSTIYQENGCSSTLFFLHYPISRDSFNILKSIDLCILHNPPLFSFSRVKNFANPKGPGRILPYSETVTSDSRFHIQKIHPPCTQPVRIFNSEWDPALPSKFYRRQEKPTITGIHHVNLCCSLSLPSMFLNETKTVYKTPGKTKH